MGLLDKVKDTAGKVAEQVAEQAKHGTAIAKERLEDARTQKKVDDLYVEIGRLTVESKRGTAPADVATVIDAKVAELTELEAQIAAADAADAAGAAGAAGTGDTAAAPADVPTAPP